MFVLANNNEKAPIQRWMEASLLLSIKTAATYSPTFRQYHRRDGA